MKKHRTATRGKLQLADSAEQAEEKIRKRAHELYELRGRKDGFDLEDWLKAESEVKGSTDGQ